MTGEASEPEPMPRAHLSEEAEREEAEGRMRLYQLRSKIRDLRGRRQALLKDVQALSDEQRALYEARLPKQDAVERAHDRQRAIGRELDRMRRAREDARRQLDEAVANMRMARPAHRKGPPTRPDQIRREMAELERRQQTVAVPLAEENALIDRLRELRKQLAASEKEAAEWEAQEAKGRAFEQDVLARRKGLEDLGGAMAKLRAEREQADVAIRGQLVELGQLVAALREKSIARRKAYDALMETSRQLNDMEREADRIDRDSRTRRHEARRAVVDYNRSVRENVAAESGYERAAEEQLQELMKRGRVTLSG